MFASPFLCRYQLHADILQPQSLQSCRKQSDDLKLCFRAVPIPFNTAQRDGCPFKAILVRSSETESRTYWSAHSDHFSGQCCFFLLLSKANSKQSYHCIGYQKNKYLVSLIRDIHPRANSLSYHCIRCQNNKFIVSLPMIPQSR